MEIGIFTRTFEEPTLEGVLDAVAAHGIRHVQFNTSCLGIVWPERNQVNQRSGELAGRPHSDMPDALDAVLCDHARKQMDARNIKMASLSGTYNMIHPDAAVRAQGLRRLGVLAAHAAALGTDLLTLCTGTRNPDNMWQDHPQNNSPQAWQDLLLAMEQALALAEEHNLRLGIEPEVSNVVNSPRKARDLLDTMRSDRLTIVMDGANVFPKGTIHRQREILDEAFALLGDRIALAHAKDLSRDGEAGHEAAGTGLLDYDYYLKRLHQSGYQGALVLHSLTPAQAPGCVAFLQEKLRAYS